MDLQVTETLNGGDIVFNGRDLQTVDGLENMIYLALFGGDDNWWGNDLLIPNDKDSQFISQTGKTLNEVAFNSAGRIMIENAIKSDLAFLLKEFPGTTLSVTVSINTPNRADIFITMNGKEFNFQINPK